MNKTTILVVGLEKKEIATLRQNLGLGYVEEFIHGEAVRVMLVGDKYWQIKLMGETWLKSIHHDDACEMPVDKALLEDTQNLARHFNLEIVGVDYMVGYNGEKYLLEVNHIPNVTIFPSMNEAFLEYARHWVRNHI
ncbi:MAG: hypothetical protein RLZZ628_2760 [Bacteroidota bacterium]|jgi:D-alanine-D-alanine ligase-like ATP-grasp enzyme